MPTATRSRLRFVLRFQGSIMSIALALSSDSRLPMSANMTTHFSASSAVSGLVNTEKSGWAIAANRLLGTFTRNCSPSWYLWLPHE